MVVAVQKLANQKLACATVLLPKFRLKMRWAIYCACGAGLSNPSQEVLGLMVDWPWETPAVKSHPSAG